MSAGLGILQFTLITVGIFIALGAVCGAIIQVPVARRLTRLAPRTQAAALTLFAAMPLILGLGLTLVTLSPSFLGYVGLIADHCDTHGQGHPHLCLLHAPAAVNSAIAWLMKAAVAGLLALVLCNLVRGALQGNRQLRRCLSLSHYDAGRDCYLLDTPRPLAFCAGAGSSRVFVSRGMVELLSPRQLDALIAHERAHVARRDTLRLVVAGALSLFHFPRVRHPLLADLALACERACDEAAVQVAGSRVLVAETIIKVARQGVTAPATGLAFARNPTVERVEALLASAPVARIPASGLAAAVALLLVPIVFGDRLHHFTETLLGLLTR